MQIDWVFLKLKTPQVLWLKIKMSSNGALLSDFLRKKLNPMLITLEACKGIPLKSDPKFKPIFSRIQFVDGTIFKTEEFPQGSTCKFDAKFVTLLGKKDPVLLREQISIKPVKVFLHDCEEYSKDPEQVF